MGLTFRLGQIPLGVFTDTSNNVGIGAAPSGSYKFEVTGTAKISGVATFGSTLSNGTYSYTLPSDTGTLALTSALSSYVPYSGATGAVNLGAYNLTVNGISVGKGAGTGALNTAIGYLSLSQNTTGYNNLALGAYSLSTNSGGIYNAALGYQALISNTSGSSNVSVGSLSMHDNTTGQNNTAIGTSSGYYITTGSYNTIVGNYAGATTLDSNVILADGNGNLRFVGFSTGNVYLGAGTTLPTDSGYKLDVNGTGRFTSHLRFGTSETYGYLYGPSGQIFGSVGANTTYLNSGTSGLRFNNAADNATLMFMSNTGNVGIGTASPSTALDVRNLSTTDGTIVLRLQSSATNGYSGAHLYGSDGAIKGHFGWGNGTTNALADKMYFGTIVAKDVLFTTNDIERMRITSGGNVLIGTTTDTAEKLQVSGTAYVVANMRVRSPGYGTSYTTSLRSDGSAIGTLQFGNNGENFILAGNQAAGGYLIFRVNCATESNTAGIEAMRITSGGNVGIGTISASSHKLRVIDAGVAQGATLFATDNNIYNSIQVYTAGADGYNGAATVMIMGKNTSTNRSLNAGGSVNASGADYAEYMTKAIEDNIAKGDIVGVDENGLLTNIFADAKSFVVKSTDPSYVGGDTWGNIDDIGKLPLEPTDKEKEEHQAKLEAARAKVDRIAFSGQVPCNVFQANVGDYIIPINDNGKIKGQAITNPTLEQYQISVGKVWKIMEDGRAWIAVKIG